MLHQFSQGSRSAFKNFKSWTLISCISGKLTVKCMVQGDMCRKEDCVAPNFSVGRAYLSWKLSIEYPTLIWFWTLIDNNSEKYGTLGSNQIFGSISFILDLAGDLILWITSKESGIWLRVPSFYRRISFGNFCNVEKQKIEKEVKLISTHISQLVCKWTCGIF